MAREERKKTSDEPNGNDSPCQEEIHAHRERETHTVSQPKMQTYPRHGPGMAVIFLFSLLYGNTLWCATHTPHHTRCRRHRPLFSRWSWCFRFPGREGKRSHSPPPPPPSPPPPPIDSLLFRTARAVADLMVVVPVRVCVCVCVAAGFIIPFPDFPYAGRCAGFRTVRFRCQVSWHTHTHTQRDKSRGGESSCIRPVGL